MTDIRKYIDLVEGMNEGFGRPQVSSPVFGRKGTTFNPRIQETDPEILKRIEQCRQYKTAEEYAQNFNPFLPVRNSDPDWIKQQAQEETEKLMARWNHWHRQGHF